MNNDHHDSIIRYLQHFASLPAHKAYSGRLQDITLTSLSLTCPPHHPVTITIPLTPPLPTYRHARERLIALDQTCLSALNHSPITIKTYLPPTTHPFYLFEFLLITATFLAYSRRWWFAPSGPVSHILGAHFAAFSYKIQPWLFGGMVLIHGAETLYFARRKLARHGVNPRTGVFWLWVASCFVEGQFAFMRFEEAVRAKAAKEEKH